MKCLFLSCILLSYRTCTAEILEVPGRYAAIQDAILAAADSDTVIVSPGTYRENIDSRGKSLTLRSTDPSDPSIVASTVIDGGQAGPVITLNEVASATIAGLTIRSGYSQSERGAGIVCLNSNATITGNIIEGNRCAVQGGAISCTYSAAIISGNRITANEAPSAAGIFLMKSAADVSANTIADNTSAGGMTAIMAADSSGNIHGNTIAGNESGETGGLPPLGLLDCSFDVAENVITQNNGGGVYVSCSTYSRTAIVRSNAIVNNFGVFAKGLYLVGPKGSAFIIGNTIVGNESSHNSAIKCRESNPVIAGNVVVGNRSESGAAVLRAHKSNVCLVGNTFCANMSRPDVSVIRFEGGYSSVVNCVFRGNKREDIKVEPYLGDEGKATVSHSIARATSPGGGLIFGPGNIDADPLFVDPGHWDDAGTPSDPSDDTFIPGDYHLLPGSPCIDAGTNDVDNPDTPEIETLPPTDISGLPRVIDGDLDGTATVDIGAYEYLPGDVNYDGKVNVLDLLLVRNSIGRDPASSVDARNADVNADGAVNVDDLLAVRGRLGR